MKYFLAHRNGRPVYCTESDDKGLQNETNSDPLLEIDADTYSKIKDKLEDFYIEEEKVKERSNENKNEIAVVKELHRKNNTMQGLQEQIEEIKKSLKVKE